jgi:hypothetical protein
MKANVRINQALSICGATYFESTVTVHEASEFAHSFAVGGLINVENFLSVFSINVSGLSLSVTNAAVFGRSLSVAKLAFIGNRFVVFDLVGT